MYTWNISFSWNGGTIAGVASDNSALKSIGLSMVAISALISGGIACLKLNDVITILHI